MERVITVTLYKDTAGNYSLSVSPLTVNLSVLDEEDAPVNVRWILKEEPTNPGYPNVRKLTASFDIIPTPFTIIKFGESLPTVENYVTPLFGESAADPGAEDTTANVQNDAVGPMLGDVSHYKYHIVVETNDNQQITLDPHIRVSRKRITKDSVLGH
jgi:hypothetical protein